MNLILDDDKFDEQQPIFIGDIIEKIKFSLKEAGLSGEELKKVTGNIAFGIACSIDNSSSIEFEGMEVVPYLTFQSGENEIIHCGETSYTHEYVFGGLDEIFED